MGNGPCLVGEWRGNGLTLTVLPTFPRFFYHFSRFLNLYTLSLYVVGDASGEAGDYGHIGRTEHIP